jgi:5-methylcytosine-specific restriction endonuclease McrA
MTTVTGQEIPRGVAFLQEALAERLGRPASVRPVKGSPKQWYVFDPCFSVLQRGIGSNSRGYRSGIFVDVDEICFLNVHSRAPAKLLRANLGREPEAILRAAEGSLGLRQYHYLHYSSRIASRRTGAKKWSDTIKVIESASWREFQRELAEDLSGLVRDMFPELPSAGKIGSGEPVRGSDFRLFLADYHRIELAKTDELAASRAANVVNAAWHLFACLYPWDSPRLRDSSLRRALLSKPGPLACEYQKILGAGDSACDGDGVQAAHVIPHSRGGSDRYWNGLWLCAKHHLMTEGRIAGGRSRSDPFQLDVRLIAPERGCEGIH